MDLLLESSAFERAVIQGVGVDLDVDEWAAAVERDELRAVLKRLPAAVRG